MSLDTSGAAARLLANANVIPDSCLFYCSQAIFGPYRVDGVHALTPASKADDVWTYSGKRHPGDYNVPFGFPVVFARARADGSGDVGISVGGGIAAFTDTPSIGKTGLLSIAEREKQIQNPYLGWTGDYLGWELYATTPADSNITVIDETQLQEEEEMKPQFWRWTEGAVTNSIFLIVWTVGTKLVGFEIDGRVPGGIAIAQSFARQQGIVGKDYGEVSIFGAQYKSIRSHLDELISGAPLPDVK